MNNQALNDFYQHVQEAGLLRTEGHAQRWTVAVLRSFGLLLDRGTKRALAKALPEELAKPLTRVFWLVHFRNPKLTSLEFQKKVDMRAGNSDARFARIPITAVFAGLRRLIDSDLDQRVARSLSPEIRELWEQSGKMA